MSLDCGKSKFAFFISCAGWIVWVLLQSLKFKLFYLFHCVMHYPMRSLNISSPVLNRTFVLKFSRTSSPQVKTPLCRMNFFFRSKIPCIRTFMSWHSAFSKPSSQDFKRICYRKVIWTPLVSNNLQDLFLGWH